MKLLIILLPHSFFDRLEARCRQPEVTNRSEVVAEALFSVLSPAPQPHFAIFFWERCIKLPSAV